MTPTDAQVALPEMPGSSGYLLFHNQGGVSQVFGYTADQLRFYATEAVRLNRPKCGCGEPTCVEPWEPGCGLGTSVEHARAAESQAPAGEAVGYVHPVEFEEMRKEGGSIKLGDRSEVYGRTMPLYATPQAAAVRGGEAVERWGQQFRCGCFLGFPTKGAIPKHCPQHMRDKQGSAWPLDTTPQAAQVQQEAVRELLAAEYERHGVLNAVDPIMFVVDRAAMDAIAAALRSAQVPEWRPIETAPKDGTKILIWRDGWDYAPVAWRDALDGEDGVFGAWMFDSCLCLGVSDGVLGWQEDVDDGSMPTHWMPLPAGTETEAR